MGILQEKSDGYWNYFLALERDIEVLSRYVDFCSANYPTFSLEMARILLAAGSEADVLLKAICNREHPASKASNIGAYFAIVSDVVPHILKFEVCLPRWGISLVPWESWSQESPPGWWTGYNKVKHHRDDHFQSANLQYVLEAVAAVYVLNLYWHREAANDGTLVPMPTLYRPGPEQDNGTTHNGFEFGINYKL